MERITASIIIIGNEILSGRTQDMNVQFIASKLPEIGIHLEEVRIIPDDRARIIDCVREFSSKYNYVFTTGGIGPTHDDITAESGAKAFDRQVETNEKALDNIKQGYKKMNREMPMEAKKMALMPKEANLIENEVTSAPGFNIENVYVMAGIPKIMKSMFMSILPTLIGGDPVLSQQISIMVGESKVAERLEQLQNKYPNVEMGSYPFIHKEKHSTSLVLRSDRKEEIKKAYSELKEMVKEYEIIT